MTRQATPDDAEDQAAFWNARYDRYSVEHLFGDGFGKLHDPDEARPANTWVIVRESRTIDSELPASSAVGVFTDGEVARRICDLITSTASSDGG